MSGDRIKSDFRRLGESGEDASEISAISSTRFETCRFRWRVSLLSIRKNLPVPNLYYAASMFGDVHIVGYHDYGMPLRVQILYQL
jgi:hypothetical protein